MLKKSTAWIVLIYGVFLAGLGTLGYFRTGSLISLVAGGSSGLVLILTSIAIFAKKRAATYFATFITLLMMSLFAIRYSMSALPIPAILAVISGGVLLFLLARISKWKE